MLNRNSEKTNYFIFLYKRQVNLGRVVMGNVKILWEMHNAYLGVIIDPNLKFNYHVNHVKRKMFRILWALNEI